MSVLLKEYYLLAPDKEMLTELRSLHEKGEPLLVKGVIQRAEAKNQNGRIYPKDVLEKECARYQSEFVDKGISLGELDHTDEPVIALKNVSHLIRKLWWEGDDVMGEVQLLNTPAGKIAQEIVVNGIPLGISSRAIGSVTKNEDKGADVVQDDLQLICFDLVGTPSTDGAFLGMHEAKEIKNFNRRKILPPTVRIKQVLSEILNREIK